MSEVKETAYARRKRNKQRINDIKDALMNTQLSQAAIAEQYGVSSSTVSNLNIGKTYKDEGLNYPLRERGQTIEIPLEDLVFINYLKDKGYRIKQIHIIVGEYSYESIRKAYNGILPTEGEPTELQLRREKVFKTLTMPRHHLISKNTTQITLEDATYITFLARFNVSKLEIYHLVKDKVEQELILTYNPKEFGYPIKFYAVDKEWLEYYNFVNGQSSTVLRWAYLIHSGRVKSLKGRPIYFDDMPLDYFELCLSSREMEIAQQMIDFKTNETWPRRPEGQPKFNPSQEKENNVFKITPMGRSKHLAVDYRQQYEPDDIYNIDYNNEYNYEEFINSNNDNVNTDTTDYEVADKNYGI